MKHFIRDFFTFNKRERNGVFILLSIITLLLIWLKISYLFVKERPVDFSKFETLMASAVVQEDTVRDVPVASDDNKTDRANHQSHLQNEKTEILRSERFDFDPNGLSEEKWIRLGLNEKQIHVIKNYESKGGKFRKKEDLKKMYCISTELYNSLEPYVHIPSEEKIVPVVQKQKGMPVEINSADSVQLLSLKGIGPYYAGKIVKYRTQLGGFVRKEQLMEIWKFDSVKFVQIEKSILLDQNIVKKRNINTCTPEELKHPYLRWNQVNAIINYRNKHGKYQNVDEIKKTDLVDDETLRKIAPYLTVE